jgi:glucose-6-phosphate isomerase
MEKDQQNANDGGTSSFPLLLDAPSRPLIIGIGGSAGGLQAAILLLEPLGRGPAVFTGARLRSECGAVAFVQQSLWGE